MIKKCAYCKKEKETTEFVKQGKYFSAYCKPCRLLYKRSKYKRVVHEVQEIPNEMWVDIVNFNGMYQVSNFGRVKSLQRQSFGNLTRTVSEKILKCGETKYGYLIVWLYSNGIRKGVSIHRLVALSFIINPENKKQVNHIDGNKLNNCVSNLEWTTISENQFHAYKTGLRKSRLGMKNKVKNKSLL